LILFCFGLHHQITIQLLKYWFAFDWRTTLLTFVQGIGHLSNYSHVTETNRPGNSAGPAKSLDGGLPLCWDLLTDQQQPLSDS
jgi:hypothetical protein